MEHTALGKDFKTPLIFYPNTRNGTPKDVHNEIRDMWADRELGNDDYTHYTVDPDWAEDDDPKYPALDEYLRERGIKECLIHWGW